MATVNFAQSARTDLLEVWLFIAEENLNAADRVLETIDQEAGYWQRNRSWAVLDRIWQQTFGLGQPQPLTLCSMWQSQMASW